MKTIVLVDDFENTRWLIEMSLKSLHLEILKAENGKDALKYFDGRHIDLLLTDVNMPVMNGIELVREVKNIPQYATLPVVMLTTEKNPEKIEQAHQLKITFWLQKPYKNEELTKVIKKCTGLK